MNYKDLPSHTPDLAYKKANCELLEEQNKKLDILIRLLNEKKVEKKTTKTTKNAKGE